MAATEVRDCGCEVVGGREFLCSYHEGYSDAGNDPVELAQLRAAAERVADLEEAIERLLWQCAPHEIRNGRPVIGTSAMSAFETAFDVLGWDDPHEVSAANLCDIEACANWRVSGVDWEGLYIGLCSMHTLEAFRHNPRPAVRAWAVYRERLRDAERRLTVEWVEAYEQWVAGLAERAAP